MYVRHGDRDGEEPPPHTSQLGFKEYWNATYTHDLATHTALPSYTGTAWFSESNATPKVAQYLETLLPALSRTKSTATILDIGSGNGALLLHLRARGWTGTMVGVDYSPGGVALARMLAHEQQQRQQRMTSTETAGEGETTEATKREEQTLRFEIWDVMKENAPTPVAGGSCWMVEEGFDIVLDKGTFDAISLNDEVDAQGRKVFEGYGRRVEKLMRKGGALLITICNWTEAELKAWFAGGELEMYGTIKYPSFSYGGSTGQSISSLCFRRIR